jgi:molybdopterin molybdotransferase
LADLLSVDQALEQILTHFNRLPSEMIDISLTLGRVLAEDIRADVSLPPFANSSMDGYAVRAADVHSASKSQPVRLRVTMDIPAGTAPRQPVGPGEAARIMTGAPMPDGADAIVPVEETDTPWKAGDAPPLNAEVTIFKGSKVGDYVRPIGEDITAGQMVLAAGTPLRPQDIGMLAALGRPQIPVVRQPRVVILSTGDELVEAHEPLTQGKIRDVNGYTLAGLVATYGGQPIRIPIARDALDDVRRRFHEGLAAKPDVILSSAGVSVGTFDMVRTVLAELGEVGFWRVNLRPGKPLAFGHLQGVPFYGLPGNPVSAMVTFDIFVRPALLKLTGSPDVWPTINVTTKEDISSDGRRSYLRVTLSRENGEWTARTTGTQSSGALMSMVLADGLLIVPEGATHLPAGSQLQVRVLRNLY